MAGMEMFFHGLRRDFKSAEDTLVALFHWCMVTNGYKCVANGDEVPASPGKGSELLPDGWNDSQDRWSIVYCHNKKYYVLSAIKVDGELIVTLLDVDSSKVSDMTIKTSQYTTEDRSAYEKAYKKEDQLKTKFKKEVLDQGESKSKSSSSTTASTSTQDRGRSRDPDDDPLRVPSRHDPLRVPPRHGDPHAGFPPYDPFAVGRGDLDPFSGGMGGGMYMDPRHGGMPGMPRGPPRGNFPGSEFIPPGARFDPFGPPDLNPRGGRQPGRGGGRGGIGNDPDPDHLPPPGYDDMFM